MNQTEKIKEAFDRQVKVVTLREGKGIGTAVTKVKVKAGMTCEIMEGDWKIIADMPENWGGNNQGPDPGILGRGALGSCITMGYMRWAAKMGIQIDELEIEVHADYNTRGELGFAKIHPGYGKIKYEVNIVSPSPKEEIIKMMDIADKYSSYIDHFVRHIEIERGVKLNVKEEVES